METARIITEGENQFVILPKSCHVTVNKLYACKIGYGVLLAPVEKEWEEFMNSLDDSKK